MNERICMNDYEWMNMNECGEWMNVGNEWRERMIEINVIGKAAKRWVQKNKNRINFVRETLLWCVHVMTSKSERENDWWENRGGRRGYTPRSTIREESLAFVWIILEDICFRLDIVSFNLLYKHINKDSIIYTLTHIHTHTRASLSFTIGSFWYCHWYFHIAASCLQGQLPSIVRLGMHIQTAPIENVPDPHHTLQIQRQTGRLQDLRYDVTCDVKIESQSYIGLNLFRYDCRSLNVAITLIIPSSFLSSWTPFFIICNGSSASLQTCVKKSFASSTPAHSPCFSHSCDSKLTISLESWPLLSA